MSRTGQENETRNDPNVGDQDHPTIQLVRIHIEPSNICTQIWRSQFIAID